MCDLLHLHLSASGHRIHVTRSRAVLGRRSRYRAPALNARLPDILDLMAAPEVGALVQTVGVAGRPGSFVYAEGDEDEGASRRTTIEPGGWLRATAEHRGVTLDDLGASPSQEVIVLRDARIGTETMGRPLDYEDTPTTQLFRRQMNDINTWLEEVEVVFDEEVFAEGTRRAVDHTDRRLRRIFSQGRFDSGGRLFGGFWQRLKKAERRHGLFIDGNPTVELDYGQIVPRIVYGRRGLVPPAGDLYAIPGFEDYRSGIKKMLNAALFATRPLTRFPRGVGEAFGRHHRVADVVEAITKAHPAIADTFFSGVGHHAQFLESEILVGVLLRLRELGIHALPIHDAIVIPATSVTTASEVMLSVFREAAGAPGLVSVEGCV